MDLERRSCRTNPEQFPHEMAIFKERHIGPLFPASYPGPKMVAIVVHLPEPTWVGAIAPTAHLRKQPLVVGPARRSDLTESPPPAQLRAPGVAHRAQVCGPVVPGEREDWYLAVSGQRVHVSLGLGYSSGHFPGVLDTSSKKAHDSQHCN